MIPSAPITDFPRYPVTAGVCILAIAVSAASWMGHPINALYLGGEMLDGELWRLVTSMFPHVNIMHLFFNVMWTWYFGTLLERTFGGLATLALIVGFAVASMGCEYALMNGGVGLSGVGYGFWALVAVLAKYDRRFYDAVDKRTNVMFAMWFAICVVATIFDIMHIANIAHGVGAIAGWLAGSAIAIKSRRIVNSVGLAVVLAFAVAGATVLRPVVNLTHNNYSEANLCVQSLEANDLTRADRFCTVAVRTDPKDMISYWNLGLTDLRLGRSSTDAARYVMRGSAAER